MRRTSGGQTGLPARPRSTWGERALVLGGFAVAALHSAASLALGIGTEAIGPLWLAATRVPSRVGVGERSVFAQRHGARRALSRTMPMSAHCRH